MELKVYGVPSQRWLSAIVPNVPCGVESNPLPMQDTASVGTFLMYRVELKVWSDLIKRSVASFVPNVPCGVESIYYT